MAGFLEKYRASSKSAQRRLRARDGASADPGHVPALAMQQPAGQAEIPSGDEPRHVLPSICHGKAGAVAPNGAAVRAPDQDEGLSAEYTVEDHPISHAEVLGWLGRGGYIRYALIEEVPPEEGQPSFRVLLLTSWRNGYYPFALNHQGESKFRDLHQLLKMLRAGFAYPGSIEVRQENAPKKRKGAWTRTSPIARGRQSDA